MLNPESLCHCCNEFLCRWLTVHMQGVWVSLRESEGGSCWVPKSGLLLLLLLLTRQSFASKWGQKLELPPGQKTQYNSGVGFFSIVPPAIILRKTLVRTTLKKKKCIVHFSIWHLYFWVVFCCIFILHLLIFKSIFILGKEVTVETVANNIWHFTLKSCYHKYVGKVSCLHNPAERVQHLYSFVITIPADEFKYNIDSIQNCLVLDS